VKTDDEMSELQFQRYRENRFPSILLLELLYRAHGQRWENVGISGWGRWDVKLIGWFVFRWANAGTDSC